jgi:post-segregation antitoxin (ccd killing protein)
MKTIEEIARQLRNKKAKEWRDKNKEKVAEINKRYWINKAKKQLEEKGE